MKQLFLRQINPECTCDPASWIDHQLWGAPTSQSCTATETVDPGTDPKTIIITDESKTHFMPGSISFCPPQLRIEDTECLG